MASALIISAVPIDIASTENTPAIGMFSEYDKSKTIKAPEHGRTPIEAMMPNVDQHLASLPQLESAHAQEP